MGVDKLIFETDRFDSDNMTDVMEIMDHQTTENGCSEPAAINDDCDRDSGHQTGDEGEGGEHTLNDDDGKYNVYCFFVLNIFQKILFSLDSTI